MSSSVRVWRLGSGAAAILFSTLGRCVTFVSPTNERNQTTKKKQRESHRGPNLEPERAKKQNKRRHVFLGGTRSWKSSNGSTFQILKNKNQKKKKEKKMAGHFRLSAGGGQGSKFWTFFGGFLVFLRSTGSTGSRRRGLKFVEKKRKSNENERKTTPVAISFSFGGTKCVCQCESRCLATSIAADVIKLENAINL